MVVTLQWYVYYLLQQYSIKSSLLWTVVLTIDIAIVVTELTMVAVATVYIVSIVIGGTVVNEVT